MTKEDLILYLEADRKAQHGYAYHSTWQRILNPFLIDREIWRFQVLLRKCEYYYTQKPSILVMLKKYFYAYQYKRQSIKLGFTIPVGVFGKGLHIAHRGTIVVHAHAKIGDNCHLNAGVNIGTRAGLESAVPKIGSNVYIGPGAKIYGDIEIADSCAIGANAVVNKSFLEPGCIIAGVPARVIGKVDRNLNV